MKLQVGGWPAPAAMHCAMAFAGTWHGWQLLPHVATSKSETQAPLQRWKPAAQTRPQSLPSHVAVELAADGHALQLVPQVAVAKFETH